METERPWYPPSTAGTVNLFRFCTIPDFSIATVVENAILLFFIDCHDNNNLDLNHGRSDLKAFDMLGDGSIF